jgi:RNA polymerase sigma-70 factor, ECF subfamily
MDSDQRRVLEAEIKRRFDTGDLDATMAAAIEGYGNELFGFLVGLARDHDRASDVFAEVCERLWRGLGAFRWESSFRVWMYAVARNEYLRFLRRGAKHERAVPLSQAPATLSGIVERIRTSTPIYMKTEVKDAFARIREELPPEDHMLLGLRLDRKMAWNDIARILGSGDPATLERDAATLRKKFERLKERLRALAKSIQPT